MKYERGSFIVVPSREKLRGMPVPAQALYMWLCAYANEEGECFPSRTKLAKDLDCSLPTVDRFTDYLMLKGLLKVEKRFTEKGENMANLYSLVIWEGGSKGDLPPSKPSLPPVVKDVDTELNPILTKSTVRANALPYELVKEAPDSEGDSGDSKSPRISGDKLKAYNELVRWSEKERGFPFLKTHITKQYKAFKIANGNGITRDQLIAKWEDMSSDKFWLKNGFDWMNVIEEFNKKPV